MTCAQSDLEDRPGQQRPFWCDAAGVALPHVEQSSLTTAVVPRAVFHPKTRRGAKMLSA